MGRCVRIDKWVFVLSKIAYVGPVKWNSTHNSYTGYFEVLCDGHMLKMEAQAGYFKEPALREARQLRTELIEALQNGGYI